MRTAEDRNVDQKLGSRQKTGGGMWGGGVGAVTLSALVKPNQKKKQQDNDSKKGGAHRNKASTIFRNYLSTFTPSVRRVEGL